MTTSGLITASEAFPPIIMSEPPVRRKSKPCEGTPNRSSRTSSNPFGRLVAAKTASSVNGMAPQPSPLAHPEGNKIGIFSLTRNSRRDTPYFMNTSHPTTTRTNPDIRGETGRTEKVVPINPMQSTDAAHQGPDLTNLEDTLRDACARATTPIHPLFVRLKLYRAVVSLARGLMLARADAGLPPALDADLVMLLDQTRDSASDMAIDPDLPVMDAILLYNVIATLCRLAHRARGRRSSRPVPINRKISSCMPVPASEPDLSVDDAPEHVIPAPSARGADAAPVVLPVGPVQQDNAAMATEAGRSPGALKPDPAAG